MIKKHENFAQKNSVSVFFGFGFSFFQGYLSSYCYSKDLLKYNVHLLFSRSSLFPTSTITTSIPLSVLTFVYHFAVFRNEFLSKMLNKTHNIWHALVISYTRVAMLQSRIYEGIKEAVNNFNKSTQK